MASESQDRNLPASERKIRKARQDGQVARSRDLAHLAIVGGGGALLVASAPALGDWLTRLLATALRFDARRRAAAALLGGLLAPLQRFLVKA
jgi:flagellar biosynthetic protein FlhB